MREEPEMKAGQDEKRNQTADNWTNVNEAKAHPNLTTRRINCAVGSLQIRPSSP